MLANEKGKSRSTRELRARKAVKWRLLYLSSGEMSLADKIGEDGRGRKETAGQRVRVVEVPTDTGVHGLFENPHDVPDAAQFAKRLAGAAKTYYGAPARAFIAAVSGDLEKTNGFIRQGVQAFIDGRKLEGASGQVKRVCERFGIAAAAGELAINLGIVPWPKGEAIKAAAGCFQAWIDARGGIEAAEVTNGIAAVRAFLSAQGSSRFEAAWEEPPRDRDGNPVPPRIANQAGWRKRVILEDGEAWDYLISADAWREAAAGSMRSPSPGHSSSADISCRAAMAKARETRKSRATGKGASITFRIRYWGVARMANLEEALRRALETLREDARQHVNSGVRKT